MIEPDELPASASLELETADFRPAVDLRDVEASLLSPTTLNRDPRNAAARDRALAVLEAAIQAAKAAPGAT